MLHFLLPTEQNRADVLSFYQEFEESGGECIGYGGHIGYAVRPSKRNHGLATKMLAQGLDLSKEFGFDRILCVCDEDNYASEAVILKNSGILEDTRLAPDENVVVKRHWINL